MTEFTQWCTTGSCLIDTDETGWVFRLMHASETGILVQAHERREPAPSPTFEEFEGESLKEKYLRRKEWESARKASSEPVIIHEINLERDVPFTVQQGNVVLTHIDHKPSDGICLPNIALIKIVY